LSFGLSTLFFAVVFKQLPDVKIQWRDVSLAAIITGTVFTVSNVLFGLYVRAFSATVVGATGSLILLLLWIFLVSQFMLFGAEFSKTYTITMGSHAKKTSTTTVTDTNEEKTREQEREKREKREEIEKDEREQMQQDNPSPFEVDVTVKFKAKHDR
jgi:membrane protein